MNSCSRRLLRPIPMLMEWEVNIFTCIMILTEELEAMEVFPQGMGQLPRDLS